MPRIFASYSRQNVIFAQRLDQALKALKWDVWIDWEDIPPGVADFNEEIRQGIINTDAFIAILSPNYLASPYCLQELNFAEQQGKRIIPIIYQKFPNSQPPAAVAAINWIYFCPHAGQENSFDDAFKRLIDAVETDYDFVRTHTRLYGRANEWVVKQKSVSLLLRGDDLRAAQAWLASSANRKPPVTPLHMQYITESRLAETKRQRTTLTGVVAALVVTIILSIISIVFAQQSEQRRVLADANAATAIAAGNARATQEHIAVGNLHQRWLNQSLIYADLSRQQYQKKLQQRATILALEAVAHSDQGIYSGQAVSALINSIMIPAREVWHLTLTAQEMGTMVLDRASRLLVQTVDTYYLWDLPQRKLIRRFNQLSSYSSAIANKDQTKLLLMVGDGSARMIDLETGRDLFTLTKLPGTVQWSPDETKLLACGRFHDTDKVPTVQVWDAQTGVSLWSSQIPTEGNFTYGEWLDEGKAVSVFSGSASGNFVRIMSAQEGTLQERQVLDSYQNSDNDMIISWSHDDTRLAYCDTTGKYNVP